MTRTETPAGRSFAHPLRLSRKARKRGWGCGVNYAHGEFRGHDKHHDALEEFVAESVRIPGSAAFEGMPLRIIRYSGMLILPHSLRFLRLERSGCEEITTRYLLGTERK